MTITAEEPPLLNEKKETKCWPLWRMASVVPQETAALTFQPERRPNPTTRDTVSIKSFH